MSDIPSLAAEVGRLTAAVGFWNRAVIAMMIFAAVAAAGLVVVQWITTKRSESLTTATGKLSDAKEAVSSREVAAAKLRAEQTDLKRIALQNRMLDIFGSRVLTAQQLSRIAGSLAGVKGAKVDVYVLYENGPYASGDFADSEKIGSEIVRTLRGSPVFMNVEGWILKDCHGASASNVVVTSRLPRNPGDWLLADRLLKALKPEIGTHPEIGDFPPACSEFSDLDKFSPNTGKHDAAVSITIGRKVTPLLTRDMLEPTVSTR